MVDACERLLVLLTQEERIYKTSDYLTRLQVLELDESTPTSSPSSPKKRKSLENHGMDEGDQEDSPERRCQTGASGSSEGSSASQINKHWREKICEWAYQGTSHDSLRPAPSVMLCIA
jgi:hypothetical protein